MHSLLKHASPLLLLATPALSWGNIGHRTIGYLSQLYMTPEGLKFFNDIIQPTDSFDISDAATWADNHRTGPFAYTYNWHFIDARDDPPSTCKVVYARDCDTRGECDTNKAPGCVVGAIVNQTARIVANDNPVQAMKFLLHFVGDAHQPLHAENLDRGGNDICVKWPKHKGHHKRARYEPSDSGDDSPSDGCPHHTKCPVNLHAVWDSLMIEKLISYQSPGRDGQAEAEKAAAQAWAQELHDATDGRMDEVQDACVPVGNAKQAINCALGWASESNSYVCSYVLQEGVEGITNQDLSGDYYEGAVPIIQGQITKAGQRFAAIVNSLAASAAKNSHGDQVVMNEL